MSVHLSPLVRYLNSQGGVPESQMTAEQQKHLDSFLTQKCIAFLGKHASALRRVFSQAAGFNQTPSVPNATWGMACQKKMDMSVDQLFEFQGHWTAPKFMKCVDLENAVGCVTAGTRFFMVRDRVIELCPIPRGTWITCYQLPSERMEEQGYIPVGNAFSADGFPLLACRWYLIL